MKKVIIIGAGISGLATAIRLQNSGYEVEIFEKNALSGGKMSRLEKDGFTFDLGPTIVMMPDIYNEIFEICGRNPSDYIPMVKLDPMYQVYFNNDANSPYKCSTDLVELTRTIHTINPDDTQGFLSYLQEIHRRFKIAEKYFLQRPFRSFTDFYNISSLNQALKLKTFNSADNFIRSYIKDNRIRSMLSFQTMYIGISPYNGPSLYSMIPMIEFLYGVWFIKGGMYTMASSLEKLFIELGGKIHFNSPVTEISILNGKATGIKLEEKLIHADYVVCNADFPYAMKHLVLEEKAKGKYTDKKIDRLKYSCSCFLMLLGVNKTLNTNSEVHNFVMSDDLENNINAIFSGEVLTNGSFYIHNPSLIDSSLAPLNQSSLYVLLPISELSTAKYKWTDQTTKYYRDYLISSIKKIKGFEDIEDKIVTEHFITPEDFKTKYNAYNGATFGLQPTLLQSNHLRPQSKAKNCENLYFTGSSVHPGAGVPIVLLSAKITSQELIHDDKGVVFNY